MTVTITRRTALGAASLALIGRTPAHAQKEWPNSAVTIVVPFAAGGSTDAVARILAQQLSTEFGKPVVVENRSGATGTIGFGTVARAKPDGHTLTVGPGSTFAMAPHLMKLPYNAEQAFAGVGLIATMPMFLVVSKDSPYRTLADFLEEAKRPGTKINYGHAGVGSSMHLAVELFLQVAKVELQGVPYRGAAPAVQAVLGGEIQTTMPPSSGVMSYIKSGTVRALAVSTKERSSFAPDVPTVAEQGFPDYEVVEEIAMLAPAGTPEPILRRLNEATAAAFAIPEVRNRLDTLAVAPAVGRIEDWPPHFAAEFRKWGEVIRSRDIKLE